MQDRSEHPPIGFRVRLIVLLSALVAVLGQSPPLWATDNQLLSAQLLSVRPEVRVSAALEIAQDRRTSLAAKVAEALDREEKPEVQSVLVRTLVGLQSASAFPTLFDYADQLDSGLRVLDPVGPHLSLSVLNDAVEHPDIRVVAYGLRHLSSAFDREASYFFDSGIQRLQEPSDPAHWYVPAVKTNMFDSLVRIAGRGGTDAQRLWFPKLAQATLWLQTPGAGQAHLAATLVDHALRGHPTAEAALACLEVLPDNPWLAGAVDAVAALGGMTGAGPHLDASLPAAAASATAFSERPWTAEGTTTSASSPATGRHGTAPAEPAATCSERPWTAGCAAARAGQPTRAVTHLLNTRSNRLVETAGRLAGRVGGTEAVPVFLTALESPVSHDAARAALREIGTAALPAIIGAQATTSERLRLDLNLLQAEILADQFRSIGDRPR